ncbi:MAG: 30S ribosomal protein S6 [Deltaproteobacteria bacterium]|nr:30S ribosomal protein S6 [Deltaproteobacteria bacterium]
MAERLLSSRDIPGRLREYETIYILRPDAPETTIAEVNKKIRGVIENNGGQLLKVENWGKRRLAYEVRKHFKGTYLFWSYLGKAGLVDEVERNLKIADSVIRFYTVKLQENVDPTGKTSEVTDESFASASVPPPDEEDLAVGHRASAASSAADDDDDDDDDMSDDTDDVEEN